MDGEAMLVSFAARAKRLRELAVETAKEAAPRIEAIAKASAAAGTSPDGEAWAPKKRGGGRALPNASGAVSAVARGDVIQIVLSGVYTYHQKSKGHPREIIPSSGGAVPAPMADAIRETARSVFNRTMGAR